MNKRWKVKFLFLFLILLFAVVLGLTRGAVNLSLSELFLKANSYVLVLRSLRILTAIVVGMGLSVAGIALQAILRNPLAEPYLLGTSSGAGLCAVLALVLGVSSVFIPLAAFIGAVLTMILVYSLARQGSRIGAQSLILSGVIVSVALSAIIVFLISISTNEVLHGALWWLWGSMQAYDFKLLIAAGSIVVLGILAVFVLAQDLNAISLGEEEAVHLGIDSESLKKILFFVTSLITAALVSICGIIGFVGLIIPHIVRLLVGPNHRILIPSSCILGAAFMVFCDMLSRTLFAPMEIPIGVITAIIGAPIFIILLKRKQSVK
ncbi:MAG: iron ABC transporter permease [Candidatus Omnitrophica bacterium]|nr:iron ABC transporter permease [Candidatus Omnitrophota bacterium]